MKLCVVLVHYFTPELLKACVESILATTSSLARDLRIVVVDNGSEPRDRALMNSLPVATIRPGENLGYAAAINLAVAAHAAEVYIIINPDIEVGQDCIARLAEVAHETRGIAGPQLFLDRQRLFLLPPAEDRSFASEVLRASAASSPALARVARRRWRTHARRHWTAAGPIRSYHLSGAMLAVSGEALARVGPFDEGFKLYYEETDWLRRAATAGISSTYVPTARAAHFYNKSAGGEPHAQAWFAQSQRRFRRKHYGAAATSLLEYLGRRAAPPGPATAVEIARLHELAAAAPTPSGGQLWLEMTPSQVGFPAAAVKGALPVGDLVSAAREVIPSLGAGTYFVRLVDDEGAELWHAQVLVTG